MKDRQVTTLINIWITAVLSLVLLIGCAPQEAEEAIDDSFKVPIVDVPQLPNLDVPTYHERFQIDESQITRNVDIIIVPDTSGSIKDERASIADGFDNFLTMLPEIANVRIGVMLAHGSKASRSGKIYQKGTEPKILDNQIHTVEEIKAHLKTKMQNPHTDGHSDGGEEGLYSLYSSLNDDAKFQALKDDGLFREDAATVVIFVADEQDICAEFPVGVIPVPDPQGKEDSSYIRDCTDGAGNRTLTEELVLNKLKEKVGERPLVVGGVLYNNLNTIPLKGENELGYGYLEMIELAGGISVDMANGDYGNGLSKLGFLAMTKIEPINNFTLKVSNVDADTIKVYLNGVEVPYTYDSELNIVSLTQERSPFSIVDLVYAEKPQITKKVFQLASGANHNCALLVTGEVKCWGDNTFGQLGYGNTDKIGDVASATTAPVLSLGSRAVQLTAGAFHTCALLETGDVKCWGRGDRGQLGLGSTDHMGDDEILTAVANVNLGSNAIRKVYAGAYHNCALYMNGDVRCWGDNIYGQLGTGDTNRYGDDEPAVNAPLVALGGSAIQMDLSTISFHACAILEGGTLRCWGQNTYGQLGVGNTDNIGDDELVSAGASATLSKPAMMVTTGNRHTCALLSDNTVSCFGDNSFGQLGLGTVDRIGDDELPSSVSTVDIGFETNFIFAGNLTTCAISMQGNVKCFGQGSNGKLGQGNTDNIGDDEVPSTIGNIDFGGLAIESLAGGLNHHCFLTKDLGLVKCIGQATKGQLGNGNTNSIGDDELPSSVDFLDFLDI